MRVNYRQVNCEWLFCHYFKSTILKIIELFGEKMNVLIIGSGGREHALAWKVK
ncbi:MAG: Phosphoribosylglycinamide synthetase, domain, partial [Pseudomonadota bacterium]